MGTLLIAHFKVLVFPHRWKVLFNKVPVIEQFILVLEQLSSLCSMCKRGRGRGGRTREENGGLELGRP